MLWNVSVLLPVMLVLSACTLDLQVNGKRSSQTQIPSVGNEKPMSVDYRAKSDNNEISEIYTSADRTQFDFVTTVPGYINGLAPDPDLAGLGFATVIKNASSPSDWAEKALWVISTNPEEVEHYVNLPAGIEFCDILPHLSSINLYCMDTDYKPVSYQLSKKDKTFVDVKSLLGYVDDATYRYQVKQLSFTEGGYDLIEVRRILKSDDSETLADLLIYLEGSYRKINIAPGDLAVLEKANISGASMKIPPVLTMTSFQSSNQHRNLLFVDLSNPESLALERFFVGTDWFSIDGILDGSLFMDVNSVWKVYEPGTGLVDLSFTSDNKVGIAGNRVYFYTPWVFGQPQSFKACAKDGQCQTIISDVTGYSVLSGADPDQKKIYFVNNNVAEASRVIESVDVQTGQISVETELVAELSANSISVAGVTGLDRVNGYLVVYFDEQVTGRGSYGILDGVTEKFVDSFLKYCETSTPEEEEDFVLKNHKYLAPALPGLNYLERGFACM